MAEVREIEGEGEEDGAAGEGALFSQGQAEGTITACQLVSGRAKCGEATAMSREEKGDGEKAFKL